jgi:hypothetical protein
LQGQSLLDALEGVRSAPERPDLSAISQDGERDTDHDFSVRRGEDEHVPCAFLWVTGESKAKVLARDGRVVVEEGAIVRERLAAQLRPDDRVILGLGANRWSPADEFTNAVVEAVQVSHPELVRSAKEWRRALSQFRDVHRLSITQLRARLAAVGVGREMHTLEGWLELDRASPIAPRGLRAELTMLWPLIEEFAERSLDDVTLACARLRALRAASGRALLQLWKGRRVELGVDDAWLSELVDQLRHEVQVYEVEAVTLGDVPVAMLGWWVPVALVSPFESGSAQISPVAEDRGEDEVELT